MIAVHKVGYMQHFSSRGVPGSCSTDAGVCLREQAGSSEGIPATHNANSNTCSNKTQHGAALESWCPFAHQGVVVQQIRAGQSDGCPGTAIVANNPRQ